MLQKFRKWFEPPVFPNDEVKTRRAWVLSALLNSALGIIIPLIFAIIFIVAQKIGVSILLVLFFLLIGVANLLVKRGNIQAAGLLYVSGLWLLFTFLYVFGGKTSSNSSSLYISIVITSGILLGGGYAIGFSLLSGLVMFGMAMSQINNLPLIVIFPGPPIPSIVPWSVAVFLTLQPIYLMSRSFTLSSEKLRESEERLNFVLEGSQLGYWDWNIKTGKVQRNEQWAKMLGYTLKEIESSVSQWTDLQHPDDRERAWKSIQDHLEGIIPEHKVEYRMLAKSGQYKWILDQARIVERDEEGRPLRMSGTHTDITELKKMQESEHELRILAEALIDSAAVLNSSLNFDEILDHIMDNVGQVVVHDLVAILLLDETRKNAHVTRYRNSRTNQDGEVKMQFSILNTKNLFEMKMTGKPVIVHDTHHYEGWVYTHAGDWIRSVLGVPIKIKNEVIGFLSLNRAEPNVYTQQDAERLQVFVNYASVAIENARLYEEVRRLALVDPLTGIYNRTFFEAEILRMEYSRDFPISIIVTDLDNMKTTNDTLGHPAGDELLRTTVRILKEIFRADEIVARIGGDEFAILLTHTDETTLKQILLRMHTRIKDHNSAKPDLPVILSIGAATAESGKLMDLFVLADQRMYAEKRERKRK